MEIKTARLTLLIDPNKKAAFERLCARQDRTASQVVRQLIREYLVVNGVTFVASGVAVVDELVGDTARAQVKSSPKRKAVPAPKLPAGRRKL
jgi:hypothetical protein